MEGLLEAVQGMIEGQPERLILRLVPACADTQDQAPTAHLVGGRRHFRQDRRMAKGIAQHQRADLHALGRFGQGRQDGPAFPNSPGRLTRIAIEEVVSEPDAIEAIRWRVVRDCADSSIRMLAVVFAVIRQYDHQSNLHGLPSAFFGTRYLPTRSVLLLGVLIHLLQWYSGNRRESFLIDRVFTQEQESGLSGSITIHPILGHRTQILRYAQDDKARWSLL